MSRAVIGRWGRSLAIRIPAEVAGAVGLAEGERVDVGAQNGEIVIRRSAPRFRLAELFRGRSAAEWRREYSGAYDWGPDLGCEIVPE